LTADQANAVSLTLLNVNDRGAGVALAFFGFETVLEWLIVRSTFLPRWLGGLTIIAGIGWLAFLIPTLGYAVFNVVALVALIGSIATIGWLLVKGVDEERWRAVAASRGGDPAHPRPRRDGVSGDLTLSAIGSAGPDQD
jgi:hypothetical protein